MKEHPVAVILVNIFGAVAIFAYIERIFEIKVWNVVDMHSGEYDNNVWMTIITTFTIGYGDFYPNVGFGKVTAVIMTFIGVYFLSILVIGATSFLVMSNGQWKALYLLERIEMKD